VIELMRYAGCFCEFLEILKVFLMLKIKVEESVELQPSVAI